MIIKYRDAQFRGKVLFFWRGGRYKINDFFFFFFFFLDLVFGPRFEGRGEFGLHMLVFFPLLQKHCILGAVYGYKTTFSCMNSVFFLSCVRSA